MTLFNNIKSFLYSSWTKVIICKLYITLLIVLLSLNCYVGTELSNFQKKSISAILEYTADQLQIVRNDYESKLPCGLNDKSEIADSKRQKLVIRFDPAIFKADGIYYRSTGEPYKDAVKRLQFDKLRSDKFFLINLLQNIAVDLKENQLWYETARTAISNEFELIDDEHIFIVEYVRNRLMVKRLTERLAENELNQSKMTASVPQLDVSRVHAYI